MSAEERKKILQMVEEGKITAEQAASLMRALDTDADPAGPEVEIIQTTSPYGVDSEAQVHAPEFEEVKARARRLSMIPLWAGVLITVLSAWALYAIQRNAGMNFWFYLMLLPLMLGVLLIALGAGGRTSRWIYIDVDRRHARRGDGPQHITLALPLPLGVLSWFFRTFGNSIQGMNRGKVEGIIQMLEMTKTSGEPLIVNVDDKGDGERVQIFIG